MSKNLNQTLLLLKQLEDLKHKLKQFQTLLGICPFDKEELRGDKGEKGEQGEKGPTGPSGPPGEKGADGDMTFEQLTPEQLDLIRGPQGIQGPKARKATEVIQEDRDHKVYKVLQDLLELKDLKVYLVLQDLRVIKEM